MLGAKSESGPQLLKGRGRGQSTVSEPLLPQHVSKFLSPRPHVPIRVTGLEVDAGRRLGWGREAMEIGLGMEEVER